MGSILRFPKPHRATTSPAPAARRPRVTEDRFRYPADDLLAEVSCSEAPPEKRSATARAPRVSRSA